MLKQYREIQAGEMFFVGGDCSAGLKDFSVCQFLSNRFLDVPLVYTSKHTAPVMTTEIHPVLEKLATVTGYKPLIAYERNNGGMFEMERLGALNRLGKYSLFQMPQVGVQSPESTVKLGWDTNTATRPQMLMALKEAIDNKLIRVYVKQTVEEMFSFVLVQTSTTVKAQAERNAHDDHIMSLGICWQLYQMTTDISAFRMMPPVVVDFDEAVSRLHFRRR